MFAFKTSLVDIRKSRSKKNIKHSLYIQFIEFYSESINVYMFCKINQGPIWKSKTMTLSVFHTTFSAIYIYTVCKCLELLYSWIKSSQVLRRICRAGWKKELELLTWQGYWWEILGETPGNWTASLLWCRNGARGHILGMKVWTRVCCFLVHPENKNK